MKIGTFINCTLNAKDAESQINCLQRYQYHEIRIEKHPLAMALDAIHSESYEGASGCFNMRPRLKVSYAICASTPTVEMQKNAIAKFSELISAERDEDGNANWLCNSFELEQCQLGKDTVSFIGKIGKYHEPFEDIQIF